MATTLEKAKAILSEGLELLSELNDDARTAAEEAVDRVRGRSLWGSVRDFAGSPAGKIMGWSAIGASVGVGAITLYRRYAKNALAEFEDLDQPEQATSTTSAGPVS